MRSRLVVRFYNNTLSIAFKSMGQPFVHQYCLPYVGPVNRLPDHSAGEFG